LTRSTSPEIFSALETRLPAESRRLSRLEFRASASNVRARRAKSPTAE
jgi:hypothetical protein